MSLSDNNLLQQNQNNYSDEDEGSGSGRGTPVRERPSSKTISKVYNHKHLNAISLLHISNAEQHKTSMKNT